MLEILSAASDAFEETPDTLSAAPEAFEKNPPSPPDGLGLRAFRMPSDATGSILYESDTIDKAKTKTTNPLNIVIDAVFSPLLYNLDA